MRKIDKSPKIPQTLQNAPVPTKPDDVKASIYKAEDVRTQLCEDQHNKCAYCECNLTKQYNDVEHYRPKSIYYWLGYDWNNLLYACDLCNRTYKKDYFPLVNEANRIDSPSDLSIEEPLIINPANEDPVNHIKFNRYIMFPLTPQGEHTIKLFHLNDINKRPELLNNRQQLYEQYKLELLKIATAKEALKLAPQAKGIIEKVNKIIELCNRTIDKLQSPSQAYSGMLIL